MRANNQDVTDSEIGKIRRLGDFELTMLISEIHDHGWPIARQTLDMMPEPPPSPGQMFDAILAGAKR